MVKDLFPDKIEIFTVFLRDTFPSFTFICFSFNFVYFSLDDIIFV